MRVDALPSARKLRSMLTLLMPCSYHRSHELSELTGGRAEGL